MAVTAVFLFDGHCGLCHRLVRFLAWLDRAHRLSFTPLNGTYACTLLQHVANSQGSVCAVVPEAAVLVVAPETPAMQAYHGARAVLMALRYAAPAWKLAVALVWRLPQPWLDHAYRSIARRRYRWFGNTAECPIDTGLLAGRIIREP